MRSFIDALMLLHRSYREFSLRARLHVLVRFLTCPFLRIVNHVPKGARVLEIGTGHGVFARLAAERSGRRAVGVDPDLRKVRRLDKVLSVIGYDDCIRGRFDVIGFVDVLYRIPITEWDTTLTRMRQRLEPGGLLLIKEHDPTARAKQLWNRMQEWFTTQVHLTLGESFSYESPADLADRLRRNRFEDVQVQRIDRGYPHAHILYVARRAG